MSLEGGIGRSRRTVRHGPELISDLIDYLGKRNYESGSEHYNEGCAGGEFTREV